MYPNLFAELNAFAKTVYVPKGLILFRLGDPASYVYLVRTGCIALIWDGPEGVRPMDTQGPGSIVGLPAVFNGNYSVGAKTLQSSDLSLVGIDSVTELFQTRSDLLEAATQLLAKEVARMREMATGSRSGKGPARLRLSQQARSPSFGPPLFRRF